MQLPEMKPKICSYLFLCDAWNSHCIASFECTHGPSLKWFTSAHVGRLWNATIANLFLPVREQVVLPSECTWRMSKEVGFFFRLGFWAWIVQRMWVFTCRGVLSTFRRRSSLVVISLIKRYCHVNLLCMYCVSFKDKVVRSPYYTNKIQRNKSICLLHFTSVRDTR